MIEFKPSAAGLILLMEIFSLAAFAENPTAAPAQPIAQPQPSAQPPVPVPAQQPQAPPAAASLNPNDPNVAPPAGNSPLLNMMEPFDYDPRGRRDPFGLPRPDRPVMQGNVHGPLLPLQKFEINQLRLTGILWNVQSPKAIIKDPSGGIYVVGQNAKIGPNNGYVASIREGEIVVVETKELDGRLVSSALVVKLGH